MYIHRCVPFIHSLSLVFRFATRGLSNNVNTFLWAVLNVNLVVHVMMARSSKEQGHKLQTHSHSKIPGLLLGQAGPFFLSCETRISRF